jgi:ABC-type lipoprotein export system ATPase subunit
MKKLNKKEVTKVSGGKHARVICDRAGCHQEIVIK